jgi:hypothetical protein
MAGIIVGAKIVGGELLTQTLQAAFEAWAEEDVNGKYWTEQFKTEVWGYPGPTTRESPNALVRDASSPRDIYDYGRLYDSGVDSFKITSSPSEVVASWDWDARNSTGNLYAYYVHEGKGGNLAPRRWTDDLVSPSLKARLWK